MTEYVMALKNGKDIIHKTQQSTREQAVKYFSKIKQMPVEKFNEIWENGIKWELDNNEFNHENNFLKLDSSKSNTRLGWISKIEIETAIKLIADWYTKFKNGENMREVSKEQIRFFAKMK